MNEKQRIPSLPDGLTWEQITDEPIAPQPSAARYIYLMRDADVARYAAAEERAKTQDEIASWLRRVQPQVRVPLGLLERLANMIECGDYRKDKET